MDLFPLFRPAEQSLQDFLPEVKKQPSITIIIISLIHSLIHSPVVVIIFFHISSMFVDVRELRFQVIFCLFILVLSVVVFVSYCKDQVTLCLPITK